MGSFEFTTKNFATLNECICFGYKVLYFEVNFKESRNVFPLDILEYQSKDASREYVLVKNNVSYFTNRKYTKSNSIMCMSIRIGCNGK